MSEFDFLARMPIGQYVQGNSLLHRLDPRAKVFLFITLILGITFARSLTALLFGFGVVLALTLLSRVSLKFALKSLLVPLPFLLVFAVLQILLYSSNRSPDILFSAWIFHITTRGLLSAAAMLLRFLGLILAFSLTTFCTSSSELIHGLQRLLSPLNRLGLKTMDLVMVLQITLRFIPLLAQTAERIAKNQASRGADWGGRRGGLFTQVKRILPLIVPLFVISLRRAETLALAMDARAYGYLDHRSSLVEMRYTAVDILMLLIATAVTILLILG